MNKPKITNLRSVFSIFLLLASCLGIIIYLATHIELLKSLRNILIAQAILLIILRTLFTGVNGLYLKIFTTKFHVQLSVKEWFGLPFITYMGNQITPLSGGMIARAIYLKHRHSLSYTRFATLLAANYLVIFWVAGLVGMLACFSLGSLHSTQWLLATFFATVVVLISVIISLPSFSLHGRNRIVRIMNASLEGWSVVKSDRNLLVSASFITLISIVLNSASFWLAYHSINISLSPQAAVLISLLPSFFIVMNITPGNLGIQEAVISITSGLVGGGIGEGLLVALLIRASTLLPAFTFGPIFSIVLIRSLNRYQADTGANALSDNNEPQKTKVRLKDFFRYNESN
jgi:uncharacterized membrane protein YbhN (UPF0104 family)